MNVKRMSSSIPNRCAPDKQSQTLVIKHAERQTETSNFDTDLSDAISREGFLPAEVTKSDLSKLPQHQLEARLNYYEREHLFERNPTIRAECKREIERTRDELARRKIIARAEAEQVFREEFQPRAKV